MQSNKKFTGFPDDCSEQHLQTLSKFRTKVQEMGCSDPPYDDAYLLRFLRARKFDLQKTFEMWSDYIRWRKEKNVDEIYRTPIPEVKAAKQFYPHVWFRTDRSGRPIFIERIGKLNFEKFTSMISHEALEKHFIQDAERLIVDIFPACSKAKGQLVMSTLYIMDLKGAGAKMMNSKIMDILKMASKIGQDYYPETLGQMYIVNAPMFFYGLWNIVKHFVDEKTRNKIHIMGSGYKKDLLKLVDEENLPDFLGGKATAADYGEHFDTEQGPWVKPEEDKVLSKLSQAAQENDSTDEELYRPSIEIKDDNDIHDIDDDSTRSLPVIQARRGSIEEAKGKECFDIGQESPLRVTVRMLRPKQPNMSLNMIKSLNNCY